MTLKITVQGLKQLEANAKKATDQMIDALAAAIYQESLDMIGQAKRRTPVDTGRLRGSGYAAPPVETNRGPEGEVGFGTNYAIPVHENLTAFHRVGGPKFLESVMNERRRGYVARMAQRTSTNYDRGIGVKAIPATAPGAPKA